MPEISKELKEAVDGLQKNLVDITTDLQPRITALEKAEKGSAEVKETVAKISLANASLVDQIKTIGEAMEKAATDRAALEETIQRRLASGGQNGPHFKTAGLITYDRVLAEQADFANLRKGAGTRIIRMPRLGLDQKSRGIMPIMVPDETKAITNAGGSAGDTVDYMRIPGLFGPGERTLLVRDLLPMGRTTSDTVRFVRETARTDAAAPQAGQGVLKGESDFDFTAATAAVETIAHFAVISTQLLDDAVGLQSYLDSRMRYFLLLEEEDQLLNGDGATNNLNGLNTQATAYNAALETSLGIASVQDIDRLRVAMLQVVQAEYPPTGVVINPFNWAAITLLKDSQQRYLWVSPVGDQAPRMWGLPVSVCLSQPQHEFLVGSFALGAQIWDRMDAAVALSTEDSTNFRQNLATIRMEERLALTVYRTAAFVNGEFSTAGSGS